MERIQAIETEYSGYLFRSRLEARWAVFLDTLGIPWDYEPEGYHLEGVGYYLPDFRLLDRRLWLEIKGESPTPDEKRKAQALSERQGINVTILYGRITAPIVWQRDPRWLDVESSTYHAMTFYGTLADLSPRELFLLGYVSLPEWIRSHQGWEAPDFDGTIECARELRRIDHAIQLARTDEKAGLYVERTGYGVCQDQQYWAYDGGEYLLSYPDVLNQDWLGGQLGYAYQKAQQARFEHGERP